MPNYNNKRYNEDLIMGEKGEKDAHPLLEKKFGKLTKTSYQFDRFDFKNKKFIIELKTRSCNHNSFDRDGGLMFNYSKIEEMKQKKDKRDTYFAFNCVDGIYYWKYIDGNYTIGMGGRDDRECSEKSLMAKVLSKDMICLYKKPNWLDTYCLDTTSEED